MKRYRFAWLLVLVVIMAMAVTVPAQALREDSAMPGNYSGTWILDEVGTGSYIVDGATGFVPMKPRRATGS